MCRSFVAPQAEHALAELVLDMAKALDPEHPERVVIGPVDFGGNDDRRSRPLGAVASPETTLS